MPLLFPNPQRQVLRDEAHYYKPFFFLKDFMYEYGIDSGFSLFLWISDTFPCVIHFREEITSLTQLL